MLDRNIDKVERIIELTSNSGKKEQFRVGDVVDINYRKPFDPRGVGYNGSPLSSNSPFAHPAPPVRSCLILLLLSAYYPLALLTCLE